MKAIVINRHPGTAVDMEPSISIIPSSAMVSDGKPLFTAGFSTSWTVTPALAIRLSRLGKSIGRQFAPRYYDSVMPVMMVRAAALSERPDLQALGCAIDGALIVGRRQPLSDDGSYRLVTSGHELADIALTREDLDTDNAIAVLSTYMTLQMGDLLIVCTTPIEIPVNPGDRLTASLNGVEEALSVRIK